MNKDNFIPLKDFSLYEINCDGEVRKKTTKRKITPQHTISGDRFHLYDSGHHITISRSKIIYCYNHNVSPYEIRNRVISNGMLLDISEHCQNLKELNAEKMINIKHDYEKEDLIFYYDYAINFLSLMQKMITSKLNKVEANELSQIVKTCIRKSLVRYYRNKGEYKKEEIDDIAKDIFYGTFLKHCPFNLDCYVYEIVKRKMKNKK